jgi:hypothetical protein
MDLDGGMNSAGIEDYWGQDDGGFGDDSGFGDGKDEEQMHPATPKGATPSLQALCPHTDRL